VHDEINSLVDHAVVHVLPMRGEVAPVDGADRVIGNALLDGLRRVQRADGDRRRVNAVQESARRLSEERNGRDVVSDIPPPSRTNRLASLNTIARREAALVGRICSSEKG